MTSIMALPCAVTAGQQSQSSFVTSAPSTGTISEMLGSRATWRLCQGKFRLSDYLRNDISNVPKQLHLPSLYEYKIQ